MKKMTTESFIERSKQAHGDCYDYSKVIYVNSLTKVTIICPTHGEFSQYPQNHYGKKTKCPKCEGEINSNRQRCSVEEFTTKADKVHNNFFDYSNTVYTTARKNITITCPIHGDFEQLPTNHLKGVGCPSCNGGMYNPSKPTILYYLSINNGQAFKIGITNKSINERFTPADKLKIEVIKTWNFDSGKQAYDAEQVILKKFCNNKYTGQPLLESGNTDLFNIDIISQILEELDATTTNSI